MLTRATKLRDNLRSSLQLFPCEAAEVATAEAHLKDRDTQKALSKLAHARIFNDPHKHHLVEKNYTAAATLLSTAASGARAWVTFNDQLFKADMLSSDNFRMVTRFSLGLDQTNLVTAAAEHVPCDHCKVAFSTAEQHQTHALTIKASTAGETRYNTHIQKPHTQPHPRSSRELREGRRRRILHRFDIRRRQKHPLSRI